MTSPGGFSTPREQAAAEQRQRERYLQLKASLTPEQAANIGALARQNPSLAPGALYAAGKAGIAPGSAAAQAMGEADAKVKKDSGGFSFGSVVGRGFRGVKRGLDAVTPDAAEEFVKDDVYSALKGTTRGLFGLATAPGEAIQGAFREAAADGAVNWQDIVKMPGRLASNLDTTSIGEVFGQVRRNGLGGVDAGSGFFIGGKAAQAQRANAIAQAPMQVNGGTVGVTFGRYYARKLDLEPGGTALNLVSGLADGVIGCGVGPDDVRVAADEGAAGPPSSSLATLARVSAGSGVRLGAAADRWGSATMVARSKGCAGPLTPTESSSFWQGRAWPRARAVSGGPDRLREGLAPTGGRLDPSWSCGSPRRTRAGRCHPQALGPALGRPRVRAEVQAGRCGAASVTQGVSSGLGTLAPRSSRRPGDPRMLGVKSEEVIPKDDMPGAIKNMDNFLKTPALTGPTATIITRMTGGHRSRAALRHHDGCDGARGHQGREMGVKPERARELFKVFQDTTRGGWRFWQDQIAQEQGVQRPAPPT